MKRFLMTLAGWLLAHKYAAAATASATAAIVADKIGSDPWPWAIGAFGAAVIYVKRPPSSRADAIVNTGISILLGGIASPVFASAATSYVRSKQASDEVLTYLVSAIANDYLLALGLSCLWPWLAQLAWAWGKTKGKMDAQ